MWFDKFFFFFPIQNASRVLFWKIESSSIILSFGFQLLQYFAKNKGEREETRLVNLMKLCILYF